MGFSYPTPIIVKVFPAPVCPYANTVPLYPSKHLIMLFFPTLSNTAYWSSDTPIIWSKAKDLLLSIPLNNVNLWLNWLSIIYYLIHSLLSCSYVFSTYLSQRGRILIVTWIDYLVYRYIIWIINNLNIYLTIKIFILLLSINSISQY